MDRTPLCFGPYRLDEANARLTRDGQPVALAPKAMAVLACLARRGGQLVSKDTLLDTVWGHRHVSDGVVKTVVSELRAALGDDPREPRWIETVPRRGYRFLGVDALTDASAHGAAGARPAAPAPAPAGNPLGARSGARSGAGAVPAAEAAPPDPAELSRMTGLVGRQPELAELNQAWARAGQHQRPCVLLGGEPGVGKTALLDTWMRGLPPRRILLGQCVESHGGDEPYLPVLEALGAWCAEQPDQVMQVRRFAPTWLVQLPWLVTDADRVQLHREVSGATQDRMLREMGALLDHLAQEQPLLLALEDLHWSDAATLRLLDVLARRRSPAGLMILCTYRPADVAITDHPLGDLRREWRLHALCQDILLDGLDPPGLAALLSQHQGRLAPGVHALPDPAFVQALHQHTEGLPLFALEVLQELQQTQALRVDPQAGWTWQPGADGGLPVPASLADVIDRQFARLPADTRALLETAALASPLFQHVAVADTLGQPPEAVRTVLEDLLRRQIWVRSHGAQALPDGRWALHCRFTHALVRHTLARRVGPALRIERHRRLADSLERSWGTRSAEIASALVRHAEAGQQALRAARHATAAARNALARHAGREALAVTQRALAQLEALKSAQPPLEDAQAVRDVELSLLALRITATLLTDGLSSAAARPLVAQALELVQDLPVTAGTAALWHVAMLVHLTGRLPRTTELAQRFLLQARAGGDPHCLAAAHNAVGIDLLNAGRVRDSLAMLQRALAHARQAHTPAAGVLLRDPDMEARYYLCLVETVAGDATQAREHHTAVDALVARGTDLISEGLGRWFQVYAHFFRRDPRAIRAIGEDCVALLEARQALPALQPHRMALGWALVSLGEVERGVALARLGLERYLAQGSRQGLVGLHALVGDALLRAGDLDGASVLADDGLALSQEYGDRFALSELLRLQAEVLMRRDPHHPRIQALLQQGLALAREQGGTLWAVLAATPLVEVLVRQGQRDAAQALAQEVLADCPGHDTPACVSLEALLRTL